MAKYKIDDNNPDTYVISKLDGKKYTRITHKHVKRFNMTLDQYKNKFNCDILDTISKTVYNSLGFTKKKAIEMYGEFEGSIKWDEYRKKQAESNTFEYKNKKYGMSRVEFDEYNAKRAVTLPNLTNRHGEERGREIWDNYRKKQSHVGCSLDYFIEKYGEDEGKNVYKELNKKKSLSIDNLILRYGQKEGMSRYLSYMEDKSFGYSILAKNIFDQISEKYPNNKIYYMDMNGNKEFGVLDKHNRRYYYYDYIDLTLKKGIEFNGDVFHGNPKLFCKDDSPNPFNREKTCEKLWEYDDIKIKTIKESHDINILTIWESDYNEDSNGVIEQCINFLKND